MFDDLDATLKAMLADPSAPADLRNADVAFDTPDKDYRPSQATVNLFLHEVAENRILRDEARLVERTGNGYTSRPPSLRMDCTYLVTTWSVQAGGLKAQEEHHLLGLALAWLSRFPLIDDRFLQGALLTPPQPFPLPAMVAQTNEGQPMGQFWSALGISPKPAFSLTVTIAVAPSDQADEFGAVSAVRLQTASLQFPALAGQVFDSSLSPVAGATVTVAETGATRTSGADGRFEFEGIAFGAYTVTVQVAGQPEQQAQVAYAADSQIITIVMPAAAPPAG